MDIIDKLDEQMDEHPFRTLVLVWGTGFLVSLVALCVVIIVVVGLLHLLGVL